MSAEPSCNFGCSLVGGLHLLGRVEPHFFDPFPAPRAPRPAARVPGIGLRVDPFPLGQDRPVLTVVALLRRDEADGAVAVLLVVPLRTNSWTQPRASSGLAKGWLGQAGVYFNVRNRLSE